MALVITGKSKCGICGRVIEASDDTTAFPAFLRPTHRLYRYSDDVFHRHCFETSADREEMERLFARFRYIWDHRPSGLTAEQIEAWGRSAFSEFE